MVDVREGNMGKRCPGSVSPSHVGLRASTKKGRVEESPENRMGEEDYMIGERFWDLQPKTNS